MEYFNCFQPSKDKIKLILRKINTNSRFLEKYSFTGKAYNGEIPSKLSFKKSKTYRLLSGFKLILYLNSICL